MRGATLSAATGLALLCACSQDALDGGAKTPEPKPESAENQPQKSATDDAQALPEKSPPYMERRTMIMFPSVLDGLRLVSQQELATPGNGICVKYLQGATDGTALDVFVSDCDDKDAKDGIGAQEAKQSFNLALIEISDLSSKDIYKKLSFGFRRKLELPSADPKRPFEALAAKCSFELEGRGEVNSYVLVSVYNGCLLKLRLTMQRTPDSDTRFDRLAKAFASLLRKSGKTNVDAGTKESILNAVKALENDPLATGTLAAPAILDFAKDSEDVTVSLNPSTLPWIAAGERLPHQELLLAAFVGGNIRSQLLESKLEDSPVDGMRCVFKVYMKLRESKPSLRSPEIERLMRLDVEGRLKEALSDPGEMPRKKGRAK